MVTEQPSATGESSKRYSGWRLAFFILLAVVITTLVGGIVAYQTLFPGEFTPVQLSQKEHQQLEYKLQRLDSLRANTSEPPLQSEPYSEVGASREISLSEKELNALLANNTDLAHRLAIDLSDNLASAKLLLPLDPEFPILGGKTLKLSAGLALTYANGRPIVVLKGVSLWGVPLPNAWLGGLKNIDMVQEFGNQGGFWQAIAEGVESIVVKQGELHIVLKE